MTFRLTLATAAVVACAGCSLLAPRPDRSRYYVLTEVVPASPAPAARRPLAVGVGPIAVPGYLERAELVTRLEPNRLVYSGTARWAAPLRSQIAAILARDLGRCLAGGEVVAFPWSGMVEPRVVVDLVVDAFERDVDGTVSLVATWTLRDRTDRARAATGDVAIREPVAEATDAAAVAAMSRALGGLATHLAAAVERAYGAGGGGP